MKNLLDINKILLLNEKNKNNNETKIAIKKLTDIVKNKWDNEKIINFANTLNKIDSIIYAQAADIIGEYGIADLIKNNYKQDEKTK